MRGILALLLLVGTMVPAHAKPNATETLKQSANERLIRERSEDISESGISGKDIAALQEYIDKAFASGELKKAVGDKAKEAHEQIQNDMKRVIAAISDNIAIMKAQNAVFNSDPRDFKPILDVCSEPKREALRISQEQLEIRLKFIGGKEYKEEAGAKDSSSYNKLSLLLSKGANALLTSRQICLEMNRQATMQLIMDSEGSLGRAQSLQDQQCSEWVAKGYSPSMEACKKNTNASGEILDPADPTKVEVAPTRGPKRPAILMGRVPPKPESAKEDGIAHPTDRKPLGGGQAIQRPI